MNDPPTAVGGIRYFAAFMVSRAGLYLLEQLKCRALFGVNPKSSNLKALADSHQFRRSLLSFFQRAFPIPDRDKGFRPSGAADSGYPLSRDIQLRVRFLSRRQMLP